MNYQQIDYWLRWFDAKGIFNIDFHEPEYSDLVNDLAGVGFINPIHLLTYISRCLD